MRAIRRAVLALAIGALAAVVLRITGRGDAPHLSGGWAELDSEALLAPIGSGGGADNGV